MKVAFVELHGFTQVVTTYFVNDDNYARFQAALLAAPTAGQVMQSCGGLRKIRWADPRRGKGKRGGLRIIYLFVPEAERIYMFDVYDKDEAEDLTPDQRRVLALEADKLKVKAKKGRKLS